MIRWSIVILAVMVTLPFAAIGGRASTGIPTFISYTIGNSAAAVTSHYITYPGLGQTGDLLVSCLSINAAPSVTWPSPWAVILQSSSSTTVTASCAYAFDNGTMGSRFIVTTGSSDGDSNVTYRIRDALVDTAPTANTPATGATQFPSTNTMGSSSDEMRMFIAVYAWFAGTVSTSSYSYGLTSYSPSYPGFQSQWNNAAGTGIFSAYKVAAEESESATAMNMGSSVTSVRFLISVRPAVITASADLTTLWIPIIIFITLLALGFVRPYVHIFAGLMGIFLGYQIYSVLSDLPVASVLIAVSIFLFLEGILRRV